MKTLDFEQEYDNLFNADQRNEEAEEYSAWWYNDLYNNKHKTVGMPEDNYYPVNVSTKE